ncbi:hypothetical protein [Sphingobacterium spiritivorum]|uniref:hypothetical protein n=1 Tax=Sphingobacterium spiritivorum TaxID=258 RepID=UPI0019183FED|nr:hypothetical protein [Sphingobacterium spiritivorum]QQT24856.1 hypothetical protein I6J02_14080 [Sphingobacterium spiritivorum]
MKEIKIENITLGLSSEGMNVRVKSNKENLVLSNQNIDNVAELIEHNFNVVSNHYKLIIDREKKEFDLKDINFISISIVLHYLYMYNSWRVMYKKQENKDLRFNENDFSNPSTHDIVFNYFKTKYPNDWEEKCAVLLGIELNKLNTYYKIREIFYNK